MSVDLEQFYEVFFEESLELLAEMEARLLGLNISAPDSEDLNAIFRAAHSIKGGAGTFGFTDMTEMTHMLESLLDKLRKNEIPISSEMVDAFLKAGDVIKDQLAAHKGEGEADQATAAKVSNELKTYLEQADTGLEKKPESTSDSSATNQPLESVEEKPSVDEEKTTLASDTTQTNYIIEFSTKGVNPKSMESLLSNLNSFGHLEQLLQSDEEQICKLKLTANIAEEDIWEALAFVVDAEHLNIQAQHEETTAQTIENNPVSDQEHDTAATDTAQSEHQASIEPGEEIKQPDNSSHDRSTEPNETENKSVNQEETSPQPVEAQSKPSQVNNNTQVAAKQPNPSKASNDSSSIRVSTEKVDHMINLVGELVITQAMLAQTASEIDPAISEALNNGMNQLERNTRDLQEAVMSIRMLPISFVFSRFPRLIRDVAAKLDKKIELITVGEGTELDKGLIEKITDPLMHLVRNSLDHGIESPEKRIAAGKLAKGTITLRAFHQGGSIIIEVGDDGGGLSREKILAKAKERGLSVHDDMSDHEVWMLIFEPGFSTAEKVTDVSGRGVGMDVVRRNIQDMGGRVDIDSVLNVGTRITIRLPLTLAILDGLSVAVGDQMFIVPLTYIAESLQVNESEIKTVGGVSQVVHVRGEYLPVVSLHQVFNIKPKATKFEDGILVILDAEGQKAALFVDGLIGQHQVVIKSLEKNYRRVMGVSGATIMGDGKVALILDAAALVLTSQKTAT